MKQSSILAETRHELLDDIAAHTATVLSEHGIDAGLAEQAGHAVADHLANQWRGATLYIPPTIATRLPSVISRFSPSSTDETITPWPGSTD